MVEACFRVAVQKESVVGKLERRYFGEDRGSSTLTSTQQDRMAILEKFYEDGEHFGIIGSWHPDLIEWNAFLLTYEVFF